MTRPGAAVPCRFAGRAFGIELEADFRVPGLLERSDTARIACTGERRTQLALSDVVKANADWPAETAERTFEIRLSDRRPLFTIDREPDAGYRVWIAGLGQCVIGPEGDRILCAPLRGRNRWELLIGQGLPIAAALQGLEVLHASAVRFGARSVAFVAPSGTGKTSLALHLLAHGAEFVADDVVALEADGDTLLTHPGIGLAHAPRTEQAALRRAGIDARWPSDPSPKRHVPVPPPKGPGPLGAAYFLERTHAVEATEITPVDPPDPCLLLGATFVSHVPTAARLVTQLDICSRIARTVPVFRVRAPMEGRAADLADHIARHIRTGE
jgi:hypothetical protein